MHESRDNDPAHQAVYDELRYHLIPNMRQLFLCVNPMEYERWQGNCCRQAAVMSAVAVSLGTKDGVRIIDKQFRGRINGKFEDFQHSYLQIQMNQPRNHYPKEKWVVDMSPQQFDPIWCNHQNSFYYYPCEEYRTVARMSGTGVGATWHNLESMIDMPEFYTGLTMREIHALCLKAEKPSKEALHELRQLNVRQATRTADTEDS